MGFLEKILKKKENLKENLQIKNTDSLGDIVIKLTKSGVISAPKDDNHNTFGEELDKLVDGDLPWGWETAKQEFIKPRDNKLYDLSIKASKAENIDEEIREKEGKDLSKRLIESGILQSDIYKQFHEVMRDEISSKLYFWNKSGKIRREKSGRTYKIYYNN